MLIGLWVTTSCNMNCSYCYEGSAKHKEIMNETTADNALDFVLSYMDKNEDNKLKIQFHGGEPLLNYQLIKYVVKKVNRIVSTSKLEVSYGITTNGTLLNEEIIEFLASNMGHEFSLSIDGDEKTHDLNRKFNNKGSYKVVVSKGLQLLNKAPRLIARSTYNSATVDVLHKNIVHLLNIGFKKIITTPDYYDKNWNDEKMEILLHQMLQVKDYYDTNRLSEENISISLIEQKFYRREMCSGGIHNIHILPNGDIFPCSYAVAQPELALCNIYDKDNEEKYDLKLKELARINSEENAMCTGCTNYNCCVCTRCKLINKVLNNDFYTPVPIICGLENVKYQFLNN